MSSYTRKTTVTLLEIDYAALYIVKDGPHTSSVWRGKLVAMEHYVDHGKTSANMIPYRWKLPSHYRQHKLLDRSNLQLSGAYVSGALPNTSTTPVPPPIPVPAASRTTSQYLTRHSASGFQVGDTVEIAQSYPDQYHGWGDSWPMGVTLPATGKIAADHTYNGFHVVFPDGNGYNFPFFALANALTTAPIPVAPAPVPEEQAKPTTPTYAFKLGDKVVVFKHPNPLPEPALWMPWHANKVWSHGRVLSVDGSDIEIKFGDYHSDINEEIGFFPGEIVRYNK
jgi:hypothetical protein